MTVGEKIKAARLNKGLTQAELAIKCDLATITIRQYENGNRTPRPDQLAKIAISLGIPISELWDKDEDTFQEVIKAGSYAVLLERQRRADKFVKTAYACDIMTAFEELNDVGKEEAANRVFELTYVPKYQRRNPQKPLTDDNQANDTQE